MPEDSEPKKAADHIQEMKERAGKVIIYNLKEAANSMVEIIAAKARELLKT